MIKQIKNANNELIYIEEFIPANYKETIVFCHGITGCRKGRTKDDNYFQVLASKLKNLGYKVILFDLSGHGDSEGLDKDVVLSKSTSELSLVIDNEVEDLEHISFLAFSYGALVLNNYLLKTSVKPRKIVLYSPCLYPLESCFLNKDSLFGKDIVASLENDAMKEQGYAIVGAKNFKFAYKMLDECKNIDYTSLINNNILCLTGKDDVILNTEYNINFCKENDIQNIILAASHSLYEEIDKAFTYTIDFLEDKDEV